MHARNPIAAAALPDLWLQVVDRNFAFRDCNYSLFPSWLAWPWSHAHLVIRGTRPYSTERRDRAASRGEALAALDEAVTQYREGLDAEAVAATLLEFALTAPRAALVRLNLNTGQLPRRITGQLSVLGCRLASVRRSGGLATLGGVQFLPALESEPGGPARTDGRRVRQRILIPPGAQVRFALPLSLAQAAQRRPRPEQRIEQIEPLPSVFTNSSTFRALWPEGPPPLLGRRYRVVLPSEARGQATLLAAPALLAGLSASAVPAL